MRAVLLTAIAVALAAAAPHPTPSGIVEGAPATAWKAIAPDNLLVMDVAGKGRVVVELAPAFAPVHVGNIRLLAKSGYWNGANIYRVQDNYVAQWGNGESEKPWPKGVDPFPPPEYDRAAKGLSITPLKYPDPYAPKVGFADGWPVGYDPVRGWATLTHCYGYVGAGRGLSPDTGSGGELYAIIGQPTRHMDRNLAIVGRVIEGIDILASLPRGTGPLGFYEDNKMAVPILRVSLASTLKPAERPEFEVMDTASDSFAAYLKSRANRLDDFYDRPAGGVDVCAVQVPVRRKRTETDEKR